MLLLSWEWAKDFCDRPKSCEGDFLKAFGVQQIGCANHHIQRNGWIIQFGCSQWWRMGFTSRTFGPCLSLWANQGGYMTPVIILWMIATAATSQNWTKIKTPDSMSCVQLEMWLDIFSWIFVISSIYYKPWKHQKLSKIKDGYIEVSRECLVQWWGASHFIPVVNLGAKGTNRKGFSRIGSKQWSAQYFRRYHLPIQPSKPTRRRQNKSSETSTTLSHFIYSFQ